MEIKFHKLIYKKQTITKAINDFSDLAEFTLSQKNKYWQVEISKIDKDFIKTLPDEFKNYVLGLS